MDATRFAAWGALTAAALLPAAVFALRRRFAARRQAATGEFAAVDLPLRPPLEAEWAAAAQQTLDAILIVGADGVVVGANTAAEDLFGRTRRHLVGSPVKSLRRLDNDTGVGTVTSNGEAWVRLPDGSSRFCHVRMTGVPAGKEPGYIAESFREVASDGRLDVQSGSAYAPGTDNDPLEQARSDVRGLSAAFRDLHKVVRQYEALLQLIAAEDPFTESIAGLAHETRSAVSSERVAELRAQVPILLGRLQAELDRLEAERLGV